jgi:hypothetical protein
MKNYSREAEQMLRDIGYSLGIGCVLHAINSKDSAQVLAKAAEACDVFLATEAAGELP